MKIKLSISDISFEGELPNEALQNLITKFLPGVETGSEPEIEGGGSHEETQDEDYIDINQVATLVGKQKVDIYTEIKEETFPAHTHKIGKKHVWERVVIANWMHEQLKEEEK